jgi:hypothetical protein
VQSHGLPPVRVALTERDPVGQGLEVGALEVDLELVAGPWMESSLDVGPGDGGVDVHDEHGAAVAWEDEQVVEIELAVLASQGRIKMMGHVTAPPE